MISRLKKKKNPGSQLLNGSACFQKKVIVIKLGLQDKPGKQGLAEAIKALWPFWHPFLYFLHQISSLFN